MNFYLANNMIEVKEVSKQNSGLDPFPMLLSKSKVPKVPVMTHYPGMSLKKEEFYTPEDLICGKIVNIFG
jgi:EF-hand domain-containing protein 1